jgi:hypothetical protein
MRKKSNHEKTIRWVARELGIEKSALRQRMDTADDKELMELAVELASRGHPDRIPSVAQALGVDEAKLRGGLQDRHWRRFLENPPS